jgi:hypothetical protein
MQGHPVSFRLGAGQSDGSPIKHLLDGIWSIFLAGQGRCHGVLTPSA